MKVRRTMTAAGEALTLGHGCYHSEEITNGVIVEAGSSAWCDVCDERITEDETEYGEEPDR